MCLVIDDPKESADKNPITVLAKYIEELMQSAPGTVSTLSLSITEEQMSEILYGSRWPKHPDNAD